MELVECHSGYAYAEHPTALIWEGQRLEIDRILSTWRTPGERCFRVQTHDLRRFELTWREAKDEWQIQPLQED